MNREEKLNNKLNTIPNDDWIIEGLRMLELAKLGEEIFGKQRNLTPEEIKLLNKDFYDNL